MQEKLRWWAYKFLRRHLLVFRCPTHVSQHKPEESEQMRMSFAQSAMTMIRMNCIEGNLFVNMDETSVYFEMHHNYAINEKGAKTVSVWHVSSNNKRCPVHYCCS